MNEEKKIEEQFFALCLSQGLEFAREFIKELKGIKLDT